MVDFSALKRGRTAAFDKLTKQLEAINTKTNYSDDDGTYWRLKVDSAGNGFAIIRFLPEPDGEEDAFIRYWDHGFKGPTGTWYIEKSLTSINQPDPLAEYNSQLWATGAESNKEQVRKQKRRLHYVANIYVVQDKAAPENEGKVFRFKFGKKIFDKINNAMFPEFEDEERINPFDLWEGANFRLKQRQVEGFPNYDKSEFDKAAPLFDTDAELKKVYEKEHSLAELLDPKNFKPYAELKARLYKALGITGGGEAEATEEPRDERVSVGDKLRREAAATEKREAEPAKTEEVADDGDDDLEYFKKLAAG